MLWAIGVLLVLFAAGFCAGGYFYNLALNPRAKRQRVFEAPHNAIDTGAFPDDGSGEWLAQSGAQDECLISYDGLRLHALAIRQDAPTPKWAILAHGYISSGRHMALFARHFYGLGFNLLIPDARGHGQSGGHYVGMGWHDRRDYAAWVGRIVSWDADARIVLYGISMGGATVMMAAGEQFPANVAAAVEDCGYTSAKAEFAYQFRSIFHIPAFPLLQFASLVARLRAGYWLGEADALGQLKKTKLPILFIHGDRDTFVPSRMVYEAYEAAAGEKALFVVPGAGHGAAYAVAGEEYWARVKEFIEKYL